jgi:hypothetical protein
MVHCGFSQSIHICARRAVGQRPGLPDTLDSGCRFVNRNRTLLAHKFFEFSQAAVCQIDVKHATRGRFLDAEQTKRFDAAFERVKRLAGEGTTRKEDQDCDDSNGSQRGQP